VRSGEVRPYQVRERSSENKVRSGQKEKWSGKVSHIHDCKHRIPFRCI